MSRFKVFALICLFILPAVEIAGQGISFDAGITPAEGRIMLRSQYRHISASATSGSITTRMVPIVVAYGLKPGVTLMARNMYFHRHFSASDVTVKGINDPYLLAKFRLYRKNTRNWVVGVAPHVAVNVPIGATGVGSSTWNPDLGVNVSFRPRFFSVDFSARYRIQDITAASAVDPPDNFAADLAASHIIALNASGESALAPVVEFNYFREVFTGDGQAAPDQLLMVSPGGTFIFSDIAFEMLFQLPLYQGSDPVVKQRYRLIAGLKYMF